MEHHLCQKHSEAEERRQQQHSRRQVKSPRSEGSKVKQEVDVDRSASLQEAELNESTVMKGRLHTGAPLHQTESERGCSEQRFTGGESQSGGGIFQQESVKPESRASSTNCGFQNPNLKICL